MCIVHRLLLMQKDIIKRESSNFSFIWVIYQMMCQPGVEFKDIKLDGWDEVIKSIEDSFNLPEEKVSP